MASFTQRIANLQQVGPVIEVILTPSAPFIQAMGISPTAMKAIKILTYRNDLVLDPFTGSGTSLVAAEVSGRRWIGIELSENYSKVAKDRVQHFIDKNRQMELGI